MEKLYSPAIIAGIQKKYGFKLSKSLGQNFLTDKNIIDKIIDGAKIGQEDMVVEIGPGIGVLTHEAAALAGKVICVEIDKNLIPILKDTLADFPHVKVVNQDILKTNLTELIQAGAPDGKVIVLGNLPYYITTPIIMKILEDHAPVDSMVIMLQKEVADRIKANPSTKDYGALSVAVQYYCSVSHVANVPREVFVPRPNVDSSVIRLDVLKEHPVKVTNETIFFQMIKASFGQRRKTLSNSLQSSFPKEAVNAALSEANIDPIRRGETLSIQEFANLSNAMASIHPNI